jgi:Na+/H+ antiporter NhaD/arsenite permease-like protein
MRATPSLLRLVERSLLRLEQPPWNAVYRAAIGICMEPLFSWLLGTNASTWTTLALFLGSLFALRFIPALLRRVLPFSREAQARWTAQRQRAKHYDSYQWRKLFWIGSGLGAFAVWSGHLRGVLAVLSLICLIIGAIGLVLWRAVVATESRETRPAH